MKKMVLNFEHNCTCFNILTRLLLFILNSDLQIECFYFSSESYSPLMLLGQDKIFKVDNDEAYFSIYSRLYNGNFNSTPKNLN